MLLHTSQLIDLKDQAQMQKPPAYRRIHRAVDGAAGENNKIVMISSEPFYRFKNYLEYHKDCKLSHEDGDGYIFVTWGSYSKIKGATTALGGKGSYQPPGQHDLSIDLDDIPQSDLPGLRGTLKNAARGWNKIQALGSEIGGVVEEGTIDGQGMISLAGSLAARPVMKSTGLIKTQYFLMIHGNPTCSSVGGEKYRNTFFAEKHVLTFRKLAARYRVASGVNDSGAWRKYEVQPDL